MFWLSDIIKTCSILKCIITRLHSKTFLSKINLGKDFSILFLKYVLRKNFENDY